MKTSITHSMEEHAFILHKHEVYATMHNKARFALLMFFISNRSKLQKDILNYTLFTLNIIVE